MIKKLENESPFIIYIYKYDIQDTEGSLYMELMDMNLKELYLAIHEKKKKFPEQLLGCITISVINALSFCHGKNIIHCDVKPTNVLISQHGQIKLTDFGSAIDVNEPYDRIGGTMAYWAPDLFAIDKEGSRLDPRRDIWSLGITLAEALLGRLPYLDNEDPVPQGYETIRYLNKIIDDNNFLDVGFSFEGFRDESIFYSKFARLEYNETIIQFLSVCLQFIKKIPSLTKLQTTDFYQACPKNNDEIYEITRNHTQSYLQEAAQFFRPPVNSTVQPAPSSSTQVAALSAATKDENKNANLLIPLQCDRLLLSIRIELATFSDFRELLKDKVNFKYYAEKAHEFYTEKCYDKIQKMLDYLKAFATDVRHKDGESCIVAIMAHGGEDVVYAKGERIHIYHEIMPLFNGKNAKDLVGKPKLFIYQSCRGENDDDGVEFDDKAKIQKLENSLVSKLNIDGACFDKPQNPDPSPNDPSPDSPRSFSIYSDFFVLYATVKTTVAFHYRESESKFISAICDVFYQFAHIYDLEYMARHIKKQVTEHKVFFEDEQTAKYQQPQLESTNSNEFYMFPGVYINSGNARK